MTHAGTTNKQEKSYFQVKRQAVIQTEYLTDKIITKVYINSLLYISSIVVVLCISIYMYVYIYIRIYGRLTHLHVAGFAHFFRDVAY